MSFFKQAYAHLLSILLRVNTPCTFTRTYKTKEERKNKLDEMKKDPRYWLSISNKHSLVCHPVSIHRDVFAGNVGDKIENKYCMVVSNRGSNTDHFLGRGGAGPGKYVAAVLDWPLTHQRRRELFIQNGGNAAVRLNHTNEQSLRNFFIQNNILRVENEEDVDLNNNPYV